MASQDNSLCPEQSDYDGQAAPSPANEYPALAEVRKSLLVQWYRSPIDHARLRALSKRSDRRGWIQAGGHLLIFLMLALLCVVFWWQQSWWLFVVTLGGTGFVASFFSGTAPHELGHGTVFKTRVLNRAFLYIFSMISWWDPFDYASSHTYHHRYTTHPHADRENLLPMQPSLHPWLLLQLLTINLFLKPGRNFGKGGFFWAVYLTLRAALGKPPLHQDIPSQEWLAVLHNDQPESFRKSIVWSRLLLLFHSGVLLVAVLSGLWVLPLVFTLVSFIANIGSYLAGVTQHCGLRENVTDFRKNTRSITLNPVYEFLYWHMNWHTEHHMYANVPCYNLKALSKEIAPDMPEPKNLLGAWREMRMIWNRQQSEPGYQFDVRLPSAKGLASDGADAHGEHATKSSSAQLAESIGDLAPDGLSDDR